MSTLILTKEMMNDGQHITSIEIATLIGKPHNEAPQRLDESHQKDGACMGAGTSGKIFPDANQGVAS